MLEGLSRGSVVGIFGEVAVRKLVFVLSNEATFLMINPRSRITNTGDTRS